MEDKVRIILDAAGAQGVNVVCLQEAWSKQLCTAPFFYFILMSFPLLAPACPFFFCTRERTPWLEFAEDAETGASTVFLQEVTLTAQP